MMRNRAFYAASFCGGRGIEIGAQASFRNGDEILVVLMKMIV